MITSLIQILELQDFGYMTASSIYLESRDKILSMIPEIETMTSKAFIQNTGILRGPGISSFTDIIKIAMTLIKTSIKLKFKSLCQFLFLHRLIFKNQYGQS